MSALEDVVRIVEGPLMCAWLDLKSTISSRKKYGGGESSDNLCLSCVPCNRYKGAEIAAIDPLTDEASRLFNPRQQVWDEHFG